MPPTPLSQPEVEEIAERAAEKAVRSVLTSIGIDVDHPLKAQADFHQLRELIKLAADDEFRKDLEHMRTWRRRTESMTTKTMITAVSLLVGAAATLMWHGIQSLVHK
jgi:hypothetical protein